VLGNEKPPLELVDSLLKYIVVLLPLALIRKAK
jgi:hypothetical protein